MSEQMSVPDAVVISVPVAPLAPAGENPAVPR